MRRSFAFLAFVLALSLSLLVVPVSADDSSNEPYKAQYYVWNLAGSAEPYGGMIADTPITGASALFGVTASSQTKSFSIPLNLNEDFNRLYIGATYNKNNPFVVNADYTFALTLTLGAVADYDNSANIPLWRSTLYNTRYIEKSGRQLALIGGVKAVETATNTFTFTYTGLDSTDFINEEVFWVDFPLSSFSSYSPNDELYISGVYFGLTAEYDEEKYKSEILENLTSIGASLDESNRNLESIDESIDSLEQTIKNQYEDEKQQAQDDLDKESSNAEDAIKVIPDYSDNYSGVMSDLWDAMSTTEVSKSFSLPNGNVELFGQEFDIWAGHSSVDLTEILSNTNIQTLLSISRGLSVVACMALVIRSIYAIYSWFLGDDSDKPEIPLQGLPGDMAKGDPWGVKWR